ncbi:hypothetical protein HELRODRAFT_176208 [Helobdella robusta]|uniref:Intraflagellar transport protein 43 homolog n=1 Tax=Helobdella robusta TaxID=6412 RepID=T1FAA7_HELRO|nr:hypothetical protein HELRODRAFT_176208 [Helobdella robusta]ESN99914.1 hypothetical protein HELRODRAFT_176208 [Helobdella robusta]
MPTKKNVDSDVDNDVEEKIETQTTLNSSQSLKSNKNNDFSYFSDRIKGTKIPSKNKGSDSESEMPYIPVLEDQEAKLGETLGGNIDLKLLTMKLLPESAVQEKDEVWDWDTLFLDAKAEYMANMSEKKS